MTSNKLLVDEINACIARDEFSAAELSREIGFSTASVSLWRNDKYARDTTALETKIRRFLRSRSLSAHDENILISLLRLLDEATDRDKLIAYLVRSCEDGGSEAGSSSDDVSETAVSEVQG
jgi:DNA transposition AAA+ family ATPase